MKYFSLLLKTIFNLSLNLFLFFGILIVLIQLFSVFTLNGDLAVKINELLKPTAIKLSIVTVFTSFILSFFQNKK